MLLGIRNSTTHSICSKVLEEVCQYHRRDWSTPNPHPPPKQYFLRQEFVRRNLNLEFINTVVKLYGNLVFEQTRVYLDIGRTRVQTGTFRSQTPDLAKCPVDLPYLFLVVWEEDD
jgi:hypothetical protein